jgi:hypothetical protein
MQNYNKEELYNKNMKIVELKINDSLLAGVDAVALVESPAIEEDFVKFSKVNMAEMTYNDYPQAAIDAARRGIELNEKNNNKCATQVGKVRAQQLVNGENLSLDTIQRMRSFLIRQKGNYELATRRKDYNACGYISYLLWGGEAALPWAEKKLRQAGMEFKFAVYNNEGLLEEYAEIGPRGGIKESPKAPKSDTPNPNPKGEGTAKGDAGTTRGAEVDKETEEALQKKADEFNEKYKDKLGYGANVGALKSVYQRGLGAYNTSRSPEVAARGGAKQWAMARVNAFLYLLKEGRPQNRKYTTDFDLLPTDHPKRENFNEYLIEEIIKDSLNLNVFGYPTEYFYMCPGAKATFEHLISMEVDEDTKGMIRSAALIADNVFDLEEDIIEEGIATPEDVELASILISDFKDLMLEIDEITGMTHDVSYMDEHLMKIKAYLPTEDFEINVSGLPNYINEASTGGRKKDLFAALKEKQMLMGPLMTPMKLIPRKDEKTGEEYKVYFTADTIEKIAYKMMEDKLTDSVNIEHDGAKRVDGVYLVETWIVKDPENDKSVLYGYKPVIGQWFGIYKISDGRVWNEFIKTGKVKGFSVEGYFTNKILTNK